MEKQNIKVSHDKEEDIISLFREGSRVKFSFDLALPKGDIVLDYDFNGYIVGLEFFNASSYFPFLKKSLNTSNLKAKMSIQYGSNWAQISYELSLPNMKPVSNLINAPYNKKLILEH